MEQLVFLSGLPRAGSTLLSSILSQNPKIHAEGNSAVCQLMWDLQESCDNNANEQLCASRKLDLKSDLISAIPKIYYQDVDSKVVVDKCRSWTMPANMEMIYKYLNPYPKVIVLVRPIDEIVKSFVALRQRNGWTSDFEKDLLTQEEPIIRSLKGITNARRTNSGQFLFVTYNELVNDTKNTISKIYEFCGWDSFEHDLENIINQHPEDDSVYKLSGQHEIRPSISLRDLDVTLTQHTLDICQHLNKNYLDFIIK